MYFLEDTLRLILQTFHYPQSGSSLMWSQGTSHWFTVVAWLLLTHTSPSFFPSFFFLVLIYPSVSLWFRTELAIHHPVHWRHIPPDHPGDSVCLLETLQVRATLPSCTSSPSSLFLSLSLSLSSPLSTSLGFDIALEDVTGISISRSAVSPEHLV